MINTLWESRVWHSDMQLIGKVVVSAATLFLLGLAYRFYKFRALERSEQSQVNGPGFGRAEGDVPDSPQRDYKDDEISNLRFRRVNSNLQNGLVTDPGGKHLAESSLGTHKVHVTAQEGFETADAICKDHNDYCRGLTEELHNSSDPLQSHRHHGENTTCHKDKHDGEERDNKTQSEHCREDPEGREMLEKSVKDHHEPVPKNIRALSILDLSMSHKNETKQEVHRFSSTAEVHMQESFIAEDGKAKQTPVIRGKIYDYHIESTSRSVTAVNTSGNGKDASQSPLSILISCLSTSDEDKETSNSLKDLVETPEEETKGDNLDKVSILRQQQLSSDISTTSGHTDNDGDTPQTRHSSNGNITSQSPTDIAKIFTPQPHLTDIIPDLPNLKEHAAMTRVENPTDNFSNKTPDEVDQLQNPDLPRLEEPEATLTSVENVADNVSKKAPDQVDQLQKPDLPKLEEPEETLTSVENVEDNLGNKTQDQVDQLQKLDLPTLEEPEETLTSVENVAEILSKKTPDQVDHLQKTDLPTLEEHEASVENVADNLSNKTPDQFKQLQERDFCSDINKEQQGGSQVTNVSSPDAAGTFYSNTVDQNIGPDLAIQTGSGAEGGTSEPEKEHEPTPTSVENTHPSTSESVSDIHIDLENCYEVLCMAKKHNLESLKTAAYQIMSNEYLQVLQNSSIFGRLNAAERDLILEGRMKGRRYVVVADIDTQASSASQNESSLSYYDSDDDAWHPLSQIPLEAVSRGSSMATMFNYIFVVLGCEGPGRQMRPSRQVLCYNPLTNGWKEISPLNEARPHCKLVALNGFLYAIGGECLHTVEKYDPRQNRWTYVTPLPNDTFAVAHMATAYDDEIFVTGGTFRYILLRYREREKVWRSTIVSGSKDRTTEMVACNNFLYRFDLNRSMGISAHRCNIRARIWYECATYAMPYPAPFQCAVIDNNIHCISRNFHLRFLDEDVSPRFVATNLQTVPSPKGVLFPLVLALPLKD